MTRLILRISYMRITGEYMIGWTPVDLIVLAMNIPEATHSTSAAQYMHHFGKRIEEQLNRIEEAVTRGANTTPTTSGTRGLKRPRSSDVNGFESPPQACPIRCPSFIEAGYASVIERPAKGSGETIRWAKVLGPVDYAGGVKAWVKANPMWGIRYSRPNTHGTHHEVVAYCKLGGNAVSYRKQVIAGKKMVEKPFRQGFASNAPTFENCTCLLKVTFAPGQFINSVELTLNASGEFHTHGELHPRTTKVSADVVKMDKSLVVHNMITEMASTPAVFIKPSVVTAAVVDKVLSNRHPERERIMDVLAESASERAIQRHCRGMLGKRTQLHIDDLENERKARTRQYRRLVIHDPVSAEHFPRIIGLDASKNASGDLVDMVLTISTTSMLKFAMAHQKVFTFSTDATYKRVTSDYPIIVTGFITNQRRFQLLSMSFVLRENTSSYCKAFTHIKSSVESIFTGQTFSPMYSMGDGAW